MTAAPDDLDALRREIDALDDRLHDLLMQRTEIVERVSAAKKAVEQDPVFMRPGREAAMLRRLVMRHRGALPRTVVVRIWRELISAYCRLQAPFSVAVHAPDKSVAYWDMARRHYGSSTPMSLHRNAQQVLSAVMEKPGTLGVLPLPQDGEKDPWWPHLASSRAKAPRVVMRLPFVPNDSGQFENLGGLVIAAAEPEESGDDRSLLAVTGQDEISRARLIELLKKVDISGRTVASVIGKEAGGSEMHLVELDGFVGRDDPRLAKLIELGQRTVQQAVPLGAYAVPLAAE